MNRKEVMNELFDSMLITFGAVGAGMITRRVFSDGLSTPTSLVPTLKLGIKYAQYKKWIPTYPFKS